MFRRLRVALAAAPVVVALVWASPAFARPSGAIFTTDKTGSPVNLNKYAAKEDVYLNGGPGINAPVGAAGLPGPATYSFQVTDPSGKTLLSTDDVRCRQFTVDVNGVIRASLSTAPNVCPPHNLGASGDDDGVSVQLFPFNDTPNNGGVYKVWVTLTSALNCDAAGNKFCFVPGDSKVDNFKVRSGAIVEIDTRFFASDGSGPLDGLMATWIDTNGASNIKYSEYDPAVLAFHEAHVEAAEQGTHQITVSNQTGCTIANVTFAGKTYYPVDGTVTVSVNVKNHQAGDATYFVDVHCAD